MVQGGSNIKALTSIDPDEHDTRMLDGEGEKLSPITIADRDPQHPARLAQCEQRSEQCHATCSERHRRVRRTVGAPSPTLPAKGASRSSVAEACAEGSVGSIVLCSNRSSSPTVQESSADFG